MQAGQELPSLIAEQEIGAKEYKEQDHSANDHDQKEVRVLCVLAIFSHVNWMSLERSNDSEINHFRLKVKLALVFR
jgi:hypothetical protein